MAADDGDAADAADAADASARMLADARDADVDKQADRLRAWKASGALLLDLRDASEFHARRIERAVNVPWRVIDGRLHELPPRSVALAIVLRGGVTQDGGDDLREGEEDGASSSSSSSHRAQIAKFRSDFKGLPWNVWGFFVASDALFERAAPAAGVDVLAGEVRPIDRGRLWEPSDLVARWLPRLEKRMRDAWDAAPAFDRPSSADVPLASRPLLVDVGCGAGRDAVYAALRGWRVLALDSDAKGLALVARRVARRERRETR